MSDSARLRLDDQLCFALYAATNAVTRVYRPLLREIGLTYPQYLVMLVLWQDGPRSIHGIAERLSLPSNAITPLVDRLSETGLLERRKADHDRRVVQVVPTEAGKALETAAATAQHRVACSTGLSEADFAALRSQLHSLIDRMGTTEEPSETERS